MKSFAGSHNPISSGKLHVNNSNGMFLSPCGGLVKQWPNWWTLRNLCICLNLSLCSESWGLWYLKEKERFLYERNAGIVVIKHGTRRDVHSGVIGSPSLTWAAILVEFNTQENTRGTYSSDGEMRYIEMGDWWSNKQKLCLCVCLWLEIFCPFAEMTDGMGLRKRYFRPSDNSLVSEVIHIPKRANSQTWLVIKQLSS